MLQDKLRSAQEKLTEDTAKSYFHTICTTAYSLLALFFLVGLLFKKNFLILCLPLFLVCIGSVVYFLPKLDERRQKIGFFYLQTSPIMFLSVLVNAPIFALAKAMKKAGMGSSVAMLSILCLLILIAGALLLYLSPKGSEKMKLWKEKLKIGTIGQDDAIERPGDVVLCTNKESGKPEIWHYKDRFLHMLILGATGTGKTSQTILPLLNQDMQNMETGITVLEPKGDLAQKAYMMAEHYGRKDVVYFDPSFKNCKFFNPLFGPETEVVENMATTFRMLNPDSPQFFLDLNEQLIRNAIKVLKRMDAAEGVDGRYATLINLSTLLQNTAGQGRNLVNQFAKLSAPTDEEQKENQDIASWFLNDYFAERSKVYENTSGVRSQVAKLVSNKYLRRVLNPQFDKGERNEIDFDKHLAEGGVICICTAQGVLRDLGRFLGYFIILQLQSAVFRRPGNENTRRSHMLYIDEFQTYSNPGFSDMLTQGRSYRVACHLATQARAQMAMGGGRDGRNFVELVSTNARNIVLYPGCSKDDAEYYSKQFGEYEKVEIQTGKSYKTFNPLTGGLDRLGHPTETVREQRKMTAIFSPSDLIYRPFGEIVYCIIKRNSIQIPQVGTISYIPKELNDKLDEMIDAYIEANRYTEEDLRSGVVTHTEPNKIVMSEFEDPASEEIRVEGLIPKKPEEDRGTVPDFSNEPAAHEEAGVDIFDPSTMESAVVEAAQEDAFKDTYMDDCMDDAQDDFLL